MITWILTAISLTGNYLNCRMRKSGFVLWIICNTGWLIYDMMHATYSRAILDFVQTGFCIYGLKEWRSKQ